MSLLKSFFVNAKILILSYKTIIFAIKKIVLEQRYLEMIASLLEHSISLKKFLSEYFLIPTPWTLPSQCLATFHGIGILRATYQSKTKERKPSIIKVQSNSPKKCFLWIYKITKIELGRDTKNLQFYKIYLLKQNLYMYYT